ncbi:hypothetical protein NCS56_01096600 [Fusarium sp. Ph1]|nr:hypothetical protein NCS56_01096600 [Fusarium sp. Ph1]
MSHPSDHSNLGASQPGFLLFNSLPQPHLSSNVPHNATSAGLECTERGKHGPDPAESSQNPGKAFRYSCPFRARNKALFNPNDYSCARSSFRNMTLVKRHVINAHTAKDFTSQCDSCGRWFKKTDFTRHSKLGKCPDLSFPPDEYDKGITEVMASRLRDRRKGYQVLNWDDLCRLIFPNTQVEIPPDFEPIKESHEPPSQASQTPLYVDWHPVQDGLSEANATSYNPEVNMHTTYDTVDAPSQPSQSIPNLSMLEGNLHFSQPSFGLQQGWAAQDESSGSNAGPAAAAGALAPPPHGSSLELQPLIHDPVKEETWELSTDKEGY